MCSSRGGRHATIVILCNPLLAISTDESAVIKAPYVSTRDPPLHPHHPHHCHIQLFMSWLQLIELDGWRLLGEQIWHILIFHWSKIPLNHTNIRLLRAVWKCNLCFYTRVDWLCSRRGFSTSARFWSKRKTRANTLNWCIRDMTSCCLVFLVSGAFVTHNVTRQLIIRDRLPAGSGTRINRWFVAGLASSNFGG